MAAIRSVFDVLVLGAFAVMYPAGVDEERKRRKRKEKKEKRESGVMVRLPWLFYVH